MSAFMPRKTTYRLYNELCTHEAIGAILQKVLNGVLTPGNGTGSILTVGGKREREKRINHRAAINHSFQIHFSKDNNTHLIIMSVVI